MINAEYVESGTFVAGEEPCFTTGFNTQNQPAVVLTPEEYNALLASAEETEKQIEQKFKHRGFGQCKKWEKKLLHLAKLALGKPSPFKPKDFEREKW